MAFAGIRRTRHFRGTDIHLLVLMLTTAAWAAVPTVSNVRVAQRPGTELVDIYYDLADDGPGPIHVMASARAAPNVYPYGDYFSRQIDWTNFWSGNGVGTNVFPGTDLHIVLDARELLWASSVWDGPRYTEQAVFDILADDGEPVPGMRYIPAGTYQRGDPFGDNPDMFEEKLQTLYVSGFNIATQEVTYAELCAAFNHGLGHGQLVPVTNAYNPGHIYDFAVATNLTGWPIDISIFGNDNIPQPGQDPLYYTNGTFEVAGGWEELPVVGFSWRITRILCRLINAMHGLPQLGYLPLHFGQDEDYAIPNLAAPSYRLPTDAEWEKAARWADTNDHRFVHGNTVSHSNANYNSSGLEAYDVNPTQGYHPDFTNTTPHLCPVDTFPPAHNGLQGMAGNAAEWCLDRYFYFSSYSWSPPDPIEVHANDASMRSVRGGSWDDPAERLRSSARSYASHRYGHDTVGFRLVRRSGGHARVENVTIDCMGPQVVPIALSAHSVDSNTVVTVTGLVHHAGLLLTNTPVLVSNPMDGTTDPSAAITGTNGLFAWTYVGMPEPHLYMLSTSAGGSSAAWYSTYWSVNVTNGATHMLPLPTETLQLMSSHSDYFSSYLIANSRRLVSELGADHLLWREAAVTALNWHESGGVRLGQFATVTHLMATDASAAIEPVTSDLAIMCDKTPIGWSELLDMCIRVIPSTYSFNVPQEWKDYWTGLLQNGRVMAAAILDDERTPFVTPSPAQLQASWAQLSGEYSSMTMTAHGHNCLRLVFRIHFDGLYQYVFVALSDAPAADIELTVANQGDETLRLTWSSMGPGRYLLQRRPVGSGTWNVLADVACDDGLTSYIDDTLQRNDVREYRVLGVESGQTSATVTGKVDHVVLLVRGLRLTDEDDSSTYWDAMEGFLTNRGYTVWDACDEIAPGVFLDGHEPWIGASIELGNYVSAKRAGMSGQPWPPPETIDIIGHDMGALTMRSMLHYGSAEAGRCISLGGLHGGTQLAFTEGYWHIILGQSATFVVTSTIPSSVQAYAAWLQGAEDHVRDGWFLGAGTVSTPDPELMASGSVLAGLTGGVSNDGVVTVEGALALEPPDTRIYGDVTRKTWPLNHKQLLYHPDVLTWVEPILARTNDASEGLAPQALASAGIIQAATAEESLVLLTNGTIQAGVTASVPVTVDSCLNAEFWVSANGPMSVELVKPDSSVVDEATVDPDVTVLVSGDRHTFGYIVASAPAGAWVLRLWTTGTPPAEGYRWRANAEVENTLTAAFSASPSWAVAGDSVSLQADMSNGEGATPTTATATITPGDTAITLHDDGLHNDGAAADGLFGNAWSNTAATGLYTIRFDTSGTRTNGESYVRIGMSDVVVANGLIDFIALTGEAVRDTNTNGLWDALDVDLSVLASSSGTYRVSANLYADEQFVDAAWSDDFTINAGSVATVQVSFAGTAIEAVPYSGAYHVGPLSAATTNGLRVGLHAGFSTSSYSSSAFEPRDRDGDGLTDTLENLLGTAATLADTDHDGLTDYAELSRDGNPAGYQAGVDTNPLDADSDDDGLLDGQEVLLLGTDPLDADTDDDGVPDGDEYVADTIPTDKTSFLAITGLTRSAGQIGVQWQGGSMARQLLQQRQSLNSTNDAWQTIFTNEPPTTLDVSVPGLTAPSQTLYRIQVERP